MKIGKKILLGLLILVGGCVAVVFYSTSGVTDLVDKHLSYVREGKIKETYDEHFSKRLKEITSLQDWETMLKAAPMIAKHTNVTFTGRAVSTETGGQVVAKLEAEGSEALFVWYGLEKEDGVWKIYSLETKRDSLYDENYKSEVSGKIFDKILVGEEVAPDGNVKEEQSKTIVSPKARKIYFTAYGKDIPAGTKVSGILKHVPTGTQTEPVLGSFGVGGEVFVTFDFSSETDWPVGEYIAQVSLQDGSETIESKFKVE